MTVIVAIRTGAAAVLAADSKISTQAYVGNNPDGTPRFLPQTYDQALKIVRDLSNTAMAAFAGNGNIGEQTVTDYFSRVAADLHTDEPTQDQRVENIAVQMAQARTDFATRSGFPADRTPATIVLLAAPPHKAVAPRLWRIALEGAGHTVTEILKSPGVWFEGNADSVLSLLYGRLSQFTEAVRVHLGIDDKALADAHMAHSYLLPVAQVNFWTMPLQEAMDFAVFCATVQIEMDRFLPGTPTCGRPIDLMILEMAPRPVIRSFPGKQLHHPAGPDLGPV